MARASSRNDLINHAKSKLHLRIASGVNTHTHTHTHKHANTHTHIHTHKFPHESDFKNPGTRRLAFTWFKIVLKAMYVCRLAFTWFKIVLKAMYVSLSFCSETSTSLSSVNYSCDIYLWYTFCMILCYTCCSKIV